MTSLFISTYNGTRSQRLCRSLNENRHSMQMLMFEWRHWWHNGVNRDNGYVSAMHESWL